MSRSSNTTHNRNNWTPDHKAQRARKGAETKSNRRNERRDINDAIYGHDRYDHEEGDTEFHF